MLAHTADVLNRLNGALQQFLRSRIEMLYFLWRGDKARVENCKSFLDKVIATGRDLVPLLRGAEDQKILNEMISSAELYRSRADDFVKAAETQAGLVKEMAAVAQKVTEVTEEALHVQQERMRSDAASANLQSIVVSVLAIA